MLSNMSWKGRTPGTEMTASTTLRKEWLCISRTKHPAFILKIVIYITPEAPVPAHFSTYFINDEGAQESCAASQIRASILDLSNPFIYV